MGKTGLGNLVDLGCAAHIGILVADDSCGVRGCQAVGRWQESGNAVRGDLHFRMADVPLVYLSNRLFRTQHLSPVIAAGGNSGLAPDMRVAVAHVADPVVVECGPREPAYGAAGANNCGTDAANV